MAQFLVLLFCLLLVATGSSKPSKENCKCENLKDTNYRIVNGTRGPQLEQGLPWIGFTFERIPANSSLLVDELTCTAFVISSRWAITAAHCIKLTPNGEMWSIVYVGAGLDHNATKIVANPNNFRKIKHSYKPASPQIDPNIWNRSDETTRIFLQRKNDIALLELEEPFTFDEQTQIRPACLMSFERDRFEDTFLAAGYGLKESFTPKNRTSPNYESGLPELTMTKFSLFNLTKEYFAVNSSYSASCIGDSGSPLHYSSHNTLYVVGVLSYGLPSRGEDGTSYVCFPGEPILFVSIYQHLEWITQLTQGDLCETDSPNDEDLIRNLTTQNDFGTSDLPDDEDLIRNLTTQNDFGTTDSPDDEPWIGKKGLIIFLIIGLIVLVVLLFSFAFYRFKKF